MRGIESTITKLWRDGSLTKIVEINKKEFNSMSKTQLYRQIETPDDSVSCLEQLDYWLRYRGTPGATVYRFDRPTGNGIVWRVKA